MTISREEFEERRIDLALHIASLLARRPDLAFTANEVRRRLTQAEGRDATVEEVTESLEALVARGRVRKEEIGGREWYAYAVVERRLGFL